MTGKVLGLTALALALATPAYATPVPTPTAPARTLSPTPFSTPNPNCCFPLGASNGCHFWCNVPCTCQPDGTHCGCGPEPLPKNPFIVWPPGIGSFYGFVVTSVKPSTSAGQLLCLAVVAQQSFFDLNAMSVSVALPSNAGPALCSVAIYSEHGDEKLYAFDDGATGAINANAGVGGQDTGPILPIKSIVAGMRYQQCWGCDQAATPTSTLALVGVTASLTTNQLANALSNFPLVTVAQNRFAAGKMPATTGVLSIPGTIPVGMPLTFLRKE